MTEYHYTTYRIGNLCLSDDLKPGDVEIYPLTPEMKRKIVALMQDSIDRQLVRAMSGGYDVEINSAGPKGVTIEHVRRPRAFLPDSRQESREGGIGPHQPCAGVGATEDQSEG